tara:strand:- start:1761 stop:3632 length:1872 start_codon:yes stop_codon:yes gene_type:complete
MAILIRDNRLVLNQSDTVTGWVSTDGPTVFTTGPTPIEAGGCLGLQASASIQNAYIPITSDNYSLGGSLFIWMTNRAAFDTTANGGFGIQVGDNTNRIAYHVGGSDGTGFRHEEGPVDWANFQVDLANKPINFTAIAGSEANLNEAAITQVGVYFETIAKSVGGADNCFWDIIRFADNGVGIEVYGGTSGVPESWEQVTIEDRNEGNLRAHGIVRKVGSGAYSIQGNISHGDAVGTANAYINSVGETFLWESRRQSTNNYYRFNAVGNATGITDINYDGCVWTCPTSGSINVSNVNVDAFDVRGSVITGFNRGINTGGVSNIWSGNTFNDCGQLETTGSSLLENSYFGYTGLANTSQLYWNTTTDPNTSINGNEFTSPATLTHAIEFPIAMTNQSITITNCTFNGYSATNNTNGSTFNVLATTGTLTINVIGSSGNFSYRTAGAIVIIVVAPVTTTITVIDINTNLPIEDARIFLYSNTSVNYFSETPVTSITRSGSVATVTHTGSTIDIKTGDLIFIDGANQPEYNGTFSANTGGSTTYTYTVIGTPTTPATGTILHTHVYFNDEADINGQVTDTRSLSVNEPVRGRVRRATLGTRYKNSPIITTIDAVNGLDLTIQMIPDE